MFDNSKIESKSKEYINQIFKGNLNEVYSDVTDNFKNMMPQEQMMAIIGQMLSSESNIGEFSVTSQDNGEILMVTAIIELSSMNLKAIFAYNKEEKIESLMFVPVALNPELVENEEFKEIPIAVGYDNRLNGRLTLPKNIEKPPVIIMIQGSGSSGMDEVIGKASNAPFRDIAHGLASKGVATVRYDKRFYAYPEDAQKIEAITIEEEYLKDLDAAIKFTKENENINQDKVFVLGHSLGGMLTPVISINYPELSGVISMAGSARKLEDIIWDQQQDALAQAELPKEQINIILEDVTSQIEQIKELNEESEIDKNSKLLGIDVSYWISLNRNDPSKFIPKMTMPILVIQGKEDFQVSMDKDYKSFEDSFEGKDNVSFKVYDGLNHLFMKSNGIRSVEAYNEPGKVSEDVISDIANWIN